MGARRGAARRAARGGREGARPAARLTPSGARGSGAESWLRDDLDTKVAPTRRQVWRQSR